MFFDDPIRNRKAQAGSLSHRFGGKKGFKDTFHLGRIDPRPGVGDLYGHLVPLNPGSQGDFSLVLDRLARIDQQVQKDLMQLLAVAKNQRQLGIFLSDLGLVFQIVPGELQGFFERQIQVGPVQFARFNVGEFLEVLDDLLDPLCPFQGVLQHNRYLCFYVVQVQGLFLGLDLLQPGILGLHPRLQVAVEFQQLLVALDVFGQLPDVGKDIADRVVDLMGNPARKGAQGFQLLGLDQLGLLQPFAGGFQSDKDQGIAGLAPVGVRGNGQVKVTKPL